jgi:GrpB-like predicted nucleotidyltransferase (UPF0157 family)
MKVEVVDYTPSWAEKYQQEAQKIRRILGENLAEIYHIGSTAVPGLKAKPIIDIMPVVYDLCQVDQKNIEFEKLGYECMGEFGIVGRRYFRKGKENRTHQIHVFAAESDADIRRHLAVRDYLRAFQETAREYGLLKEKLAKKYPQDIEGYCDGKDAFVKKLEKEALSWYKDN